MPPDHGCRLDQHHGVEDLRPDSVKPHPEQPIGGKEPRPAKPLPTQDGHLVSQSNEFELQRSAAAHPEREQGTDSGQKCDHADDGMGTAQETLHLVGGFDFCAGTGRPRIPGEIRRLIREMSLANRLWGAPRIHGELRKLGIEVAQSTVARYMARSGRGRSQSWKTFLHNHAAGIGAMDFLIVPTVGFKLLFVLAILRHERRRLISLSVTANPTAEWIARQITDAFPWDEAPDYLIRDRDASYGQAVTRRLAAMGIRDHPTAPRSPWQNGHAERLIGSIRRECLDHTVVFGEGHLRRILSAYTGYYNECRTHLSLDKDSPDHRPIHRLGQLVAQPILGGLHHQYCRI
jgi:transposase InsO family protein